jgi:UDP-N-acetylglucosamine pyrophosphorylase
MFDYERIGKKIGSKGKQLGKKFLKGGKWIGHKIYDNKEVILTGLGILVGGGVGTYMGMNEPRGDFSVPEPRSFALSLPSVPRD